MKCILALDQGTTSSRAILFEHSGKIKAVAQKEFPQIFPQTGWVEHNPNEIWESQREVAMEVLHRAGLKPSDIAAIGITNQRETTLVWNRKTGQPICNAIVWQDRRTAPFCERMKLDGLESLIQRKTGLVIDAYFSGSKVKWILDNVSNARAMADAGELAFGTVDSWLVWKLTGGKKHLTDASNASRTMLFNIHSGNWDDELLNIFKIPRSMLPEVKASSEIYANAEGDLAGIPIAGIAGDQQAALFGQACFEAGMVKNTYGTGCFMLMNTGEKPIASKNKLLTTVAWRIGNKTEYALEGSVFIAGAAVQWLRDGLGIIKSSADVEALAAQVTDTGGVYLVPAFTGLGAPYWDPYARGAILGISRGTKAAHIARAALESMAFQTAEVLKAMQNDSGLQLKELRVDGGASVNNTLMQFQADILSVPVVRPGTTETTALGAAYLAGLATGFWQNREEIGKQWNRERQFQPALDKARREQQVSRWKKAVGRTRDWEEASQPAT